MYIYKTKIFYTRFKVKEIIKVESPQTVAGVFRKELIGPIEKFACLFLNVRNNVIEKYIFSILETGTTDQCAVYVKNIIKIALLVHADRIILSHNHPSGFPSPSLSDDQVTKALKDAAKLMNIDLVDHLIVTEDSFYSYNDNNRI